jgi:subtilisin family serine protease
VDFRVKPDVVAPAVNVLSSIPMAYCDPAVDPGGCFAFFQGTSMATPHLAGSAAVVKGQHPTWSAAQIRSAVVNTADQGVLKMSTSTTLETDPNIIGTGRENLFAAVNAQVAIDPVSLSFGAVPSGSGNTMIGTIALTNLTGSAQTFGLSVGASSGTGVSYSVPASVDIAAGGTAYVDITMSAARRASFGDHYAKLSVWSGGVEVAHAVVYTFIK